MKAFAFALLLVVAVAHAADDPKPPERPAPLPEPRLQIIIPPDQPNQPEELRFRVFPTPPAQPQITPPDIRIPDRPHISSPPRYWICPKDETMLRVVTANHKGNFECPVDGTAMKPAVGRSSSIFLLHEEGKP